MNFDRYQGKLVIMYIVGVDMPLIGTLSSSKADKGHVTITNQQSWLASFFRNCQGPMMINTKYISAITEYIDWQKQ